MTIGQFELRLREGDCANKLRFFDNKGQEYRVIGTVNFRGKTSQMHVVLEPINVKESNDPTIRLKSKSVKLFLE